MPRMSPLDGETITLIEWEYLSVNKILIKTG